MALVWGLSRLLAVAEEELRSRVQWANQQTFAPFLGLYHSVAPILGLAQSSEAPTSPVIDEPSLLGTSPLAKQLPLSLVQVFEPNPEQLGSAPLSPACPSLDPAVESAEEVLCEQNLGRKEEVLPSRLFEQNEDGNAQGAHAAELTLASSTTVVELDRDSFFQILAHADNSTLRACSLVCRDFLEMSNFARSVMSLQKACKVPLLPKLLMRFPQLRILDIIGLSNPPLADQPAGVCLDDAMMEAMAGCCRGLHELRLNGCSTFSDEGLTLVLRACPELSCLRLVHCGGFEGKAFMGLSCGIEKLELSFCQAITNRGLSAALNACPGLAELSVEMAQRDVFFAPGLEGAAKSFSKLTKLKLRGCGIRDQTLHCFAASCPALNDVSIGCEFSITDRGLADFFSRLAFLETVALNNNLLISRVPQFRPTLKSLSLGGCFGVPDVALQQVAELTSLQELSLIFCPFLSDATVNQILVRCPGLRRLLLEKDVSITMETVKAYAKSSSKAKLKVVQCPFIPTESLKEEEGKLEEVFINFF